MKKERKELLTKCVIYPIIGALIGYAAGRGFHELSYAEEPDFLNHNLDSKQYQLNAEMAKALAARNAWAEVLADNTLFPHQKKAVADSISQAREERFLDKIERGHLAQMTNEERKAIEEQSLEESNNWSNRKKQSENSFAVLLGIVGAMFGFGRATKGMNGDEETPRVAGFIEHLGIEPK